MIEEINDPFELFELWYEKARKNKDVKDHTELNLATSTKEGKPSNRMVLLKAHDKRGFVFYTNLTSRKGKEIADNPYASMCFYWQALGRQVRIEGRLEQVSDQEADDYFASRHHSSQAGAWASKQSQIMEHKDDLRKRDKEFEDKYANNKKIPRPEFWSGMRLIPSSIEFWEDGKYRLHKRKKFTRASENKWEINILYP